MRDKSIKELVAKAQQGDNEALEALYKNFYNQLLYYTYSRVNSIHIAQDIVSDVFLSLVEGIKKYKGDSSFKNYLFGITKNKLRDYIKTKYKSESYILESNLADNVFDMIPDLSPSEKEENKNYREKVRTVFGQILHNMKPRYAKVLDLRFNNMCSIEEVAEEMGITSNNVKVIQHRAIKQAKSIWDSMDESQKTEYLTQY